MSEAEELLKLIDGHINARYETLSMDSKGDRVYYEGILSIRWLVYNFFNAPKVEQAKNDQQDFGL